MSMADTVSRLAAALVGRGTPKPWLEPAAKAADKPWAEIVHSTRIPFAGDRFSNAHLSDDPFSVMLPGHYGSIIKPGSADAFRDSVQYRKSPDFTAGERNLLDRLAGADEPTRKKILAEFGSPRGATYTAPVLAPADRILDYDQLLSRQSDPVLDSLTGEIKRLWLDRDPWAKGSDLISAMRKEYGPQGARGQLMDLDVRGAKRMVETPEGVKVGNVSVFDAGDVGALRKIFGIAGAGAMGTIADPFNPASYETEQRQ